MNHAIQLIAKECERQIAEEGFTPEHDAEYVTGELAMAAACYVTPQKQRPMTGKMPFGWPWGIEWWKPTPDDRIKELVKAGALIVAEINRLMAVENPPMENREMVFSPIFTAKLMRYDPKIGGEDFTENQLYSHYPTEVEMRTLINCFNNRYPETITFPTIIKVEKHYQYGPATY